MIKLNTLKPNKGSKTSTRRLGRGEGSGRGKTAGRGTKGQKARSGGRKGLKLKGLKFITQRLPKLRGFKSPRRQDESVTFTQLAKAFPSGGVVSPKSLYKKGLISKPTAKAKILAGGPAKKWTVTPGIKLSAAAKAAIEKVGGSVA